MANQPASIYTAKYPRGWEARVRIPDSNMKKAGSGSANDRKFICMKVKKALNKDNPSTSVPLFIEWEKLQLDYVSEAR